MPGTGLGTHLTDVQSAEARALNRGYPAKWCQAGALGGHGAGAAVGPGAQPRDTPVTWEAPSQVKDAGWPASRDGWGAGSALCEALRRASQLA